MPDLSFLGWPFFEPRHAAWRERRGGVCRRRRSARPRSTTATPTASCRRLVAALGEAGLLAPTVVAEAGARFDVRTLCLARETLAYHDGLADFAFALQGLGSGPVSLFGTRGAEARGCPTSAAGKAIPAFALTEPEAGSDVAAMATTAIGATATAVRLDGEKTYISNGGIADWYVVFARTGEAPGARGLSAFLVDADTPGLIIAERIETIAPHPLARIGFDGCRVPAGEPARRPRRRLQGRHGDARRLPLDRRRGGARLRPARLRRDRARMSRRGKRSAATLADLQMTQAAMADMATEIDAAGAARLSRRLGQGRRGASASPARRRWPRWPRPRRRSG